MNCPPRRNLVLRSDATARRRKIFGHERKRPQLGPRARRAAQRKTKPTNGALVKRTGGGDETSKTNAPATCRYVCVAATKHFVPIVSNDSSSLLSTTHVSLLRTTNNYTYVVICNVPLTLYICWVNSRGSRRKVAKISPNRARADARADARRATWETFVSPGHDKEQRPSNLRQTPPEGLRRQGPPRRPGGPKSTLTLPPIADGSPFEPV